MRVGNDLLLIGNLFFEQVNVILNARFLQIISGAAQIASSVRQTILHCLQCAFRRCHPSNMNPQFRKRRIEIAGEVNVLAGA
ncbi:MAG TPA: hypothetical protein VLR90_07035 [Blastocatellia bacterium]|nr:hypothetical protein [Blastocatellia bacterium]